VTLDWAQAAEDLARERGAYGNDPARFPIVLGIADVEALAAWVTSDALDTTMEHFPGLVVAGVEQGLDDSDAVRTAVATMLATHTQMGIELGLWLAQTGRVKP
jgi:hypothetical protein